jgi:c-di-GMP-binding flagellar brake protein YcgR
MEFNNKEQFKKLTNEEKDKVVRDLVDRPEEILCKSMKDLFIVKPLEYKSGHRLFIEFAQNEVPLLNGDEIICQFLYRKENLYIFRCEFQNELSSPSLLLNSDFYMIQRRENYRLKFPGSLSSKVIIKSKGQQLIGKVFDLSTTGIRVACTKDGNHMSVGDQVEMEIQVVGHQPLTITAHMRHRIEGSEVLNDKKTVHFYYGFQFVSITKENEKSLSRINMELYRNFFQKVGT